MEEQPQPLSLCMENIHGDEVALEIEPQDTFCVFLNNARILLGYDVDISSITGDQTVSLDDNIYTFLLNAEQNLQDSNVNAENFDDVPEQPNDTDDLVYILNDGTQIRASQIQFDNDDPFVDITAEKIPFVKYKYDSADECELDNLEDVTVKNYNIVESPVSRWSNKDSPKYSFVNSLPFKLVCNNTSNFEAQFDKYLESSTKTYTNLSNAARNKSPKSLISDYYKDYDELHNRDDGFFTREDILNMFKDSPVTPLPYDDNQAEKRRHVRKTDPSRLVNKNWNAKPVIDVESDMVKQDCFICGKVVDNSEKLYLFDKEDQMLHRCERKYNTQLKVICEQCLIENFKPSRMKSPSQSLDSDEYLVIKNNQQFIFQKTTLIDLKTNYYIKSDKVITGKESLEFVNVEIGPDGEIVTKPIDNDVKSDDVIIVKDEKKESSSDVEIIEPEPEIDVDNFEDVDEDVKEFLGKYTCEVYNRELKCRFCNKEFKELSEVIEHGEEHKHVLEDESVYPCPLCDYGYANLKWLNGHLKAAHDQKRDDGVREENSDKTDTPQYSPVAKRTRSAIKRNDTENSNGKQKKQESKENIADHSKEEVPVKSEVKDESQYSSDDDSIWIVQTGDDDSTMQLQNLLKATEIKHGMDDLKKHKCFNCSQIFPTAESLTTHKCRKRGRKRLSLSKDESVIFIPTQEDFIKRAQGRPRPVEDKGDNDLLVVRSRKRKTREFNNPQILTCHNCEESFTSKVRLKFHMQFHESTSLRTPNGQYTCAECDEAKFPTETKLFDHVHFQHNKQRRWQCPVKECGKTFFLRATLTKHSRTHTDTRRYVCVTCGKRFLDKQTLDEHGVTHLQFKPFQCHICLKQLTRRSRLRMHLRAHEEELSPALVLVCAMCSRAFRDHLDAQEHATKSTECIEKFASELKEEDDATEQLSPTSGIVRHTVQVVEFPRLQYTGKIHGEVNNAESEKLLSALDDAARNIVRVVNIEKAYRCEYCEDVFYIEDALNNHRIIHRGVKNPFTCHICKVSFATYSRCTTHKTTHGFYKRSITESRTEGHSGPASAGVLGYGGFPVVKHFLCEDCGRSYLHWTYFQVHRRLKHANQNFIFKCNQCELTFPNSWSATYHRKKVHGKTGQGESGLFAKIARDNRIPCRDCDQLLPNKVALYTHRKKEHCGGALVEKEGDWSDQESPVDTVCNKCGHNLHNVLALQKHIKEEHGGGAVGAEGARARPHTCPVCARVFRSASVCSEHVRVHTGERPFPCDVCGVAFRRSTAMRNHRLIHTGARAWACDRCPKRFRVRSDLRTHMRLKHPVRLAVIEIEGMSCTPEQVLQHITLNNINPDKVMEVTMISFPKNSTNVVPSSKRALAMLEGVPKVRLPCNWNKGSTVDSDLLMPARRGRGIAKAQRPSILQSGEDVPQDDDYQPVGDEENLSSSNGHLLLQDGALVNGNQMVQLQLDQRMLLE